MAWKKKHDLLLRNKARIIMKYAAGITMVEIAQEYGVTPGCICVLLKSWGQVKRHGLKYLLRNMFIKDN